MKNLKSERINGTALYQNWFGGLEHERTREKRESGRENTSDRQKKKAAASRIKLQENIKIVADFVKSFGYAGCTAHEVKQFIRDNEIKITYSGFWSSPYTFENDAGRFVHVDFSNDCRSW